VKQPVTLSGVLKDSRWIDRSGLVLDYALVEHRVGDFDEAGGVRRLDRLQLQNARRSGATRLLRLRISTPTMLPAAS